MPLQPDLVEFDPAEPSALLARMVEIARHRNGWVNLAPGVRDEHVPEASPGLFSLFSGRGPAVPLATWTPGDHRRKRNEPPSIGISHGTGPKAVARLRDRGLAVPEGWPVLADHPKRGLVVAVPPDVEPAAVLEWLLEATAALATVPLTGRWQAQIYTTG